MCAEGSLTRTESSNDRLRQEADASRAEIWRKIQAAKLNNSKRHQVWHVLPLFLYTASRIGAADGMTHPPWQPKSLMCNLLSALYND